MSALEVLVLGGASVISTSAMFAEDVCDEGTTVPVIEKSRGGVGRRKSMSECNCECLMMASVGSCHHETRNEGSSGALSRHACVRSD